MPDQPAPPPPNRSIWVARFHTRMTRYRNLLARRWWIPLAIVIIAVGVQAAWIHFAPPKYISVGRMIFSIKLNIPEGSLYWEELNNFAGTQVALMESPSVQNRAQARVLAQKTNIIPAPVQLKVSVKPKTSIFVLVATGDSPDFTQAFLQACMEEYSQLKKDMRVQTSDTTVAGLTEEVLKLKDELRRSDDEMVAFASTNSVVVLQEPGNNAGTYLASLNQRLAGLKLELDLLKALSLDQNLERRERADFGRLPDTATDLSPAAGRTGSDAEYLKAKQATILLKAEQQEQAEYLRPAHPKMIALKEDIARRERLLQIYRDQSVAELESRKTALSVQVEKLEKEVTEWNVKVLDISRKTAEHQRLKANSTRIQALYDRLLATMQTMDVSKEVNPESVTVMDRASRAEEERPQLARKLSIAGLLGLAFSIGLLMLIDRLDDRMSSLTELAELFDENVLAQVPREAGVGKKHDMALVHPDDLRHSFIEAFRSLRSSVLYMSESGKPPRTMLVTSSEPNDGKSLTAANLAITMAMGGTRVLLVDGDLRKGVLHERLGLTAQPGLSEALSRGADWTQAVQATSVPTLSFLPRGGTTQKSGELFLGTAAQKFLKEAAAAYECVLMDSAPVMAADDVTTLAPHVDGVVFVIRAEQTSARVARAALDLLTSRRAQILGLVFNSVRTSSGDYYYYHKYREYYKAHHPTT